MVLGSALDALASSLHHAAWVALPLQHFRVRDHAATRDWSFAQVKEAIKADTLPMKDHSVRVDASQVQVRAMFVQRWGSTALGFGGLGGAAITPAYTVVLRGPQGHLAVYWAGRFAYLIGPEVSDEQRQAFLHDLSTGTTAGVRDAAQRYGATLTCRDLES